MLATSAFLCQYRLKPQVEKMAQKYMQKFADGDDCGSRVLIVADPIFTHLSIVYVINTGFLAEHKH